MFESGLLSSRQFRAFDWCLLLATVLMQGSKSLGVMGGLLPVLSPRLDGCMNGFSVGFFQFHGASAISMGCRLPYTFWLHLLVLLWPFTPLQGVLFPSIADSGSLSLSFPSFLLSQTWLFALQGEG